MSWGNDDYTHLGFLTGPQEFEFEVGDLNQDLINLIYGGIVPKKESTTMARRDDIQARLAALEAEAAELAFYGDDVYDEGTVLTFKAQFTEGGQVFSYAVLKAGGSWHSTGTRNSYLSWDQLVDLLRKGRVRKVRQVTGTRKVIG